MNLVLDTSILSVCATLIVGAFAAGYKFIRDIARDLASVKADLEEKIKTAEENSEKRTSGVYKRLDEVRVAAELRFVSKDVCSVMHNNSRDTLIGLESRVTAAIDKLDQKVDENFRTFLEQVTKAVNKGGENG